jgi:hypothetical protein
MYTLVRTLCIIFFDENAAFFYVQGDSIRGNESLSFRFCGSGKIPLNDLQGTEKECRWTGHPICHIVS